MGEGTRGGVGGRAGGGSGGRNRRRRASRHDVLNVSYAVATSPQRVTLTLRQPTVLGKEITFAAPTTWISFSKSPIVEDLIQRIDDARGLQS